MRLPGGDGAEIAPDKLLEYALNPDHPLGRHKARLFDQVLGLRRENAEILVAALRVAARDEQANPQEADEHGQRFQVRFTMPSQRDSAVSATIRSAWIVPSDGGKTRLVTCFVEPPR